MILMVDNYDSFTYSLVQMLTAAGTEVEVLRNDAESAEAMLARKPAGIVLSPGPGRPEEAGVCLDLIRAHSRIPLLGVCLGHQALGVAFGATVDRAPRLMHGKTSPVSHDGKGLFTGLPQNAEVGRYHSLIAKPDTLPADLEVTARTPEGEIMGVRHRTLKVEGVQFHPESVLTPDGPALIGNFLKMAGGRQ